MAVAEQQHLERSPQASRGLQLGVVSLLGAALVLFCLCFLLGGLPTIWDTLLNISEDVRAGREPILNEFLSGALLLIAMLAVGAVLGLLLREADRKAGRPGLRAGVFFGCLAIWLVLGIATKIGAWMSEGRSYDMVAVISTLVVTGIMFGGAVWLFTRPGFDRWLIRMEERGWFHAVGYKTNQGWRVRVGTLFSLLIIAGCGIYTLYSHGTLGSPRPDSPRLELRGNSWLWDLPFTHDAEEGVSLYLPILHQKQITIPILLIIGAVWVSWRAVNWPVFADFLIATEAEMNKVSWTTRRRLVQDTIVVLVTVFLFTGFLFVVDIVWIKVLANPWIPVLQIDIKKEFQKQQEKTQW